MKEEKVYQIVEVQCFTGDERLSAYTYFSKVPLQVDGIVTVSVIDTPARRVEVNSDVLDEAKPGKRQSFTSGQIIRSK